MYIRVYLNLKIITIHAFIYLLALFKICEFLLVFDKSSTTCLFKLSLPDVALRKKVRPKQKTRYCNEPNSLVSLPYF